MFKQTGLIAVTVSAIFAVSVGATVAHDGATGIVKERMDAMSHVGGTMKTLSKMASGEIPFDGKAASLATKGIVKNMANFTAKFPEGSDAHPSEAGPAIWTNNTEFATIAKQLEDVATKATRTLADATDNSVVAGVMADMGKTCKACHTKFRVKR